MSSFDESYPGSVNTVTGCTPDLQGQPHADRMVVGYLRGYADHWSRAKTKSKEQMKNNLNGALIIKRQGSIELQQCTALNQEGALPAKIHNELVGK